MSNDLISGLLRERRGRTVAAVMGALERGPAWQHLSKDQRLEVREEVMRAVNGYHDIALDLLKVVSEPYVLVNEAAIDMIRDLHERAV